MVFDLIGNVVGNEYDWYIMFFNEFGFGVFDGISCYIYNFGLGWIFIC